MGECAEILGGFVVLLFMNFLFICNLISQKANQPQSICLFTFLHFAVRDPKILFWLTCYDRAYRSVETNLASQAVVDWPGLVPYLKSIFLTKHKRGQVPLRLKLGGNNLA